MCDKTYKVRSLTTKNGKDTVLDLNLEFEGRRAFVVWDQVRMGDFELKARLEIDPKLLQKGDTDNCDFLYRGHLILPRPQDN
jgi:hypothetical protein